MKTSVWIAVVCPPTRRVLVAKRGRICRNAGQWNFFGGGVDRGERPRKTARRELCEEAGLSADETRLVPLADVTADGKRNVLFGLTVATEIKPKLNPESEAFRWLAPRELTGHRRLHSPTRVFAEAVVEWLHTLASPPVTVPAPAVPASVPPTQPELPPAVPPPVLPPLAAPTWRDRLERLRRWVNKVRAVILSPDCPRVPGNPPRGGRT